MIMTDNLTLWDIETGLRDLMLAREEAATEAEVQACDDALQAYAQAEVAKADNIRNYLRHCELMAAAAKEESLRLAARAQMWTNRKDRLKSICQVVMESMGKRRIEGRLGVLRIQGNGGKRPVLVQSPAMVPEEYCVYEGSISGRAWALLATLAPAWCGREDVQMERRPRLSLIGAALEAGEPVAGCSLGERGESLRVE